MSYVAPEIDIDRFLPELVEIVSHVNCSDFTEGNIRVQTLHGSCIIERLYNELGIPRTTLGKALEQFGFDLKDDSTLHFSFDQEKSGFFAYQSGFDIDKATATFSFDRSPYGQTRLRIAGINDNRIVSAEYNWKDDDTLAGGGSYELHSFDYGLSQEDYSFTDFSGNILAKTDLKKPGSHTAGVITQGMIDRTGNFSRIYSFDPGSANGQLAKFSIHNINKTTPPNITITENSRELVQLNYQSGTINWLSASVPARISMQPPSSM